MQKLKELSLQYEEFKSSHVYREENCPVDSVSKLSHELPEMTHFHFPSALPNHIREQILQDSISTPAFKHRKISKISAPPSNGYG